MLLTENFSKILAEANTMSPRVTGHLFIYNSKRNRFETRSNNAKNGFKARSFFLFVNGGAVLLRILNSNVSGCNTEACKGTVTTDMNLSIMMMLVCIVIAERYRVRGTNPDDFATFFNQVIQVETLLRRGKNS